MNVQVKATKPQTHIRVNEHPLKLTPVHHAIARLVSLLEEVSKLGHQFVPLPLIFCKQYISLLTRYLQCLAKENRRDDPSHSKHDSGNVQDKEN